MKVLPSEIQKRKKEFAGHKPLLVVAPDFWIQANLGEEESGRRSNRKLCWWLKRGRKVTNSDCLPTVTQSVEGGVVSQPVNRHIYAQVGLIRAADNCLSLSGSVCITTWTSKYLLDTQCCLWDSWRFAGKTFICTSQCVVFLDLSVYWMQHRLSRLHSFR